MFNCFKESKLAQVAGPCSHHLERKYRSCQTCYQVFPFVLPFVAVLVVVVVFVARSICPVQVLAHFSVPDLQRRVHKKAASTALPRSCAKAKGEATKVNLLPTLSYFSLVNFCTYLQIFLLGAQNVTPLGREWG